MNISNQQLIQLLVILLVVGFSFLSWLARKLKEQAEKKRALQEVERRRLEALRTGKDPGAGATAPANSPEEARLRELAARRQAQLQELRRRQQNRPPQGGGARPPIVILAPGSSPQAGTPAGIPGLPPGRARPPQQRPQTAPRRADAQRPRPSQPPRPAPPPSRSPVEVDTGESTTHRLVQDVRTPTAREPRKPAVLFGTPMTPQQWRRALMLREVLGQPPALSERDPEDRMI